MSTSRIYERAVLRPFAEQLVEAAHVQPREHVAELQPRSDMLSLALAALAPGAAALPVRDVTELESVDTTRALALFTAPEALAVAAAARMPVALLTWPERGHAATGDAPPLEHVIAVGFAAVTGAVPAPLDALPVAPVSGDWDVMPVTDVCRFDSVEELVTATCSWHGIEAGSDLLGAVAGPVGAALAGRTGFDGTLRVPVTALLARSR